MTELMKRYEAETGGRAESFDDIYMPVYQRDFLNWIVEQHNKLQAENAQLRNQLTWRPVSEKPENGGEYLVKRMDSFGDIIEDFDKFANRDGKWGWLSPNVISWLPLPPAPEGE